MNQPIFEEESDDSEAQLRISRYRKRSSLHSVSVSQYLQKSFKTPSFKVKRPQNTYISIDQALEYTGDNSSYSKRVLLFMASYWIWYSFLAMGISLFLGGKINYYCYNEELIAYEQCNEQTACNLYGLGNFEITPKNTIIEEFSLVCDKSYLVAYIGSLVYLSFIFSSLVFPTIVDRKGRKNVLLFCGFTASISIIIASQCYNFYLWMFFIFTSGFGFGGLETVGRVYLSEISAKNFRINSTATLNIVWAASQVALGFLLHIVQYWRFIFFYLMGLVFLFTLIIGYFFFDESPKYLVHIGKNHVK